MQPADGYQGKRPDAMHGAAEQRKAGLADRLLTHFEEKGVMVCVSGMTIFYSLTMAARYVIGIPASWADELVGFFFLWTIFLGASIGAKRGAHLGVSALHDALPTRFKKIFLVAILIISVFTCSILAWQGIKMVHLQYTMDQRSSQIGLPMFLVGLSVPLGLIFCIIRFIQAFFRRMRLLA